MNKYKYVILNGDNLVAMVYEDEKWGRTIVILEKIDSNHPVQIFDRTNTLVKEKDISEFLLSMLPE